MRKFFFLLLVLSGIFPAYSIDTHWNLEPVQKVMGHVYAIFTILVWGSCFVLTKQMLTAYTAVSYTHLDVYKRQLDSLVHIAVALDKRLLAVHQTHAGHLAQGLHISSSTSHLYFLL